MIKMHKYIWVPTLISEFETSTLTSGVKEKGYNSDRMMFVLGIATYLRLRNLHYMSLCSCLEDQFF
jgi:hypothetical protein